MLGSGYQIKYLNTSAYMSLDKPKGSPKEVLEISLKLSKGV